MDTFKIVVAGVGGQGTLLASRLLADAAISAGMHVKIGETYGMAQRGGPVMGHIQIGGITHNPQIRKGEADVLIGFEPAEAVRRGVTYLKEGGLALINSRITSPVEVVSGMITYPDFDKMIGLLRNVTDDIRLFDATGIAEEAGDAITTNIVMLGSIVESGLLPYSEEVIVEVMKTGLKPQFLELNMRAFELGKNAYHSL
jgi:indolepyruvate ferredoxin oxidoreductase beta subunit